MGSQLIKVSNQNSQLQVGTCIDLVWPDFYALVMAQDRIVVVAGSHGRLAWDLVAGQWLAES